MQQPFLSGRENMERWTVYAKRADFQAIAEKFHIDPVVARVIRNRDIIGDEAIDEYLHGGLELLQDPYGLKGMERAVRILRMKIDEKKKIRIIGDYDIDGIMSSYILKQGLKKLGADVDIQIPNRITDGYGVSMSMIRSAAEEDVDTILTCDNGISAVEPVKLAKKLGMTVIVTDHHEVLQLPDADVIIDPKQEGDTYKNKNLCGAAVAWKLILALGGDPDMHFLQYAAFATVGDIVDLTGENRIIVKEGLKQLRHTDNLGLRALAEAQHMDLNKLSSYHIGFVLGPCLNASGRLDTAMRATDLLEAQTENAAFRLAEDLKSLNDSRKAMTTAGFERAVEIISKNHYDKDKVMVVYLPDLHESIAGIVAGRIREKYGHPAFVLTNGEESVKGSGRSVEAYSMFDELVKVKDLLLKFGGHPMAAGLSLKQENIGEFRRRLNEECTLTPEELMTQIKIDVPMPVCYVTENLVEQLDMLEPFGKANEKPVFAQKHVFFEHPRLFGAKHNMLRCRVRSMTAAGDADPDRLGFQAAVEGPAIDAVCFRNAEKLYERIQESPDVSIVYEPQIDEYMGRRRVEIIVTHFQ